MESRDKGHGGGGGGEEGDTGSPAISDHVTSAWAESRRRVDEGLVVVQTAVDLMNNNQFRQAEQMLLQKSQQCMFHSLAYGTVIFLQAGFCMDREVIEKATAVLTNTVDICSRCRRSKGMMETLTSWMFGQKLDDYNPEELTAEIFYAEANLLLSFLTFLQDESLLSFVKGAIRIRNCHSMYRQLYQWMCSCEQQGVQIDASFVSGVRMGYGCFNLFLSLLPGRVLRLLEFAGFSGDRAVGLRELELGAASDTFRAPLCSSFLLFYYTVAAVITDISLEEDFIAGDKQRTNKSSIQIDADHSEALLLPQLHKYPSSVQFQYFKGRISLMRGQVDQAIESFHTAMESQDEWHQIKHLVWWELAWCHCMKTEWGQAASYSGMLYKESRWSKASFLYMHASFLIMEQRHIVKDRVTEKGEESCGGVATEKGVVHNGTPDDGEHRDQNCAEGGVAASDHKDGNLQTCTAGGVAGTDQKVGDQQTCNVEGVADGEEGVSASEEVGSTNEKRSKEDHIASLMKEVPVHKQRIAGKSIPIEAFGVIKSQRYLSGGRLPLCGMELMYSNNVFVLLRSNPVLLRQLLAQVKEELKYVQDNPDSNPYYLSDTSVCYLVKGCLLRILGEYEESREALLSLLAKKAELKSDVYCLPAALAELALLYLDNGAQLEEAEKALEEARTQYKGYVLENRIHFRIHEARNRIAACKENL